MAKKELDKIFQRFYRSKDKANNTKGHGIGLSLVKQICDLYGVKITIASEKGKGTSVKLLFPSNTN